MLNAELRCRLCRLFELFAKQIPSFCILHSEFCIFVQLRNKGYLSFSHAIAFPDLSYATSSLWEIKKSLPPRLGKQGQDFSCLCHLACRIFGRLMPVPAHRLPGNGGKSSEDTKAALVPSALGGPFAAPLFTPLPPTGALCGCACSVISASWVCISDGVIKHHNCLFVKHFFAHIADTIR